MNDLPIKLTPNEVFALELIRQRPDLNFDLVDELKGHAFCIAMAFLGEDVPSLYEKIAKEWVNGI